MVHLLDTIVSYVSPQGTIDEINMKELLSQASYTVLYFYPKDNTPGCTVEAKEFSERIKSFEKLGAQVVGVSKDSTKSHCGFQEKQELTLGLISDKEKIVHAIFQAEGKKKFMGKEYMGTLRNTYLLDNQGEVLYKWEEVRAPGHADEVLAYVENMDK